MPAPMAAAMIQGLVPPRWAAGTVVEFGWSRPQNSHRFDIFRFGEIKTRRNAGIAGAPPVGFPAPIKLHGDAAEQHGTAARSRQQPNRGVPTALPRRSVLGARLGREGRCKYGQADAERGSQGNFDDHETSLQPSETVNH